MSVDSLGLGLSVTERWRVDHIVYDTPLLTVGLFRCPVWHHVFRDVGHTDNHLLVFPRTSVVITQGGRQPVVASPNVVMLYNRHQEYRRDKLSDWGDMCEFFIFRPETIIDVYRSVDPSVEERVEQPFLRSHGPSTPDTYLQQRLVVQHILNNAQPDSLYVEETMLTVLAQTLKTTHQAKHTLPATRPATKRLHSELVHQVQVILSTHFQKPPSLPQLAHNLHTSPHHLCRIFRRYTGTTIHQYLNQIRLRLALSWVAEGATDLTQLALDLGYVHHSHFSQAFRRAFGFTPRAWRKQITV